MSRLILFVLLVGAAAIAQVRVPTELSSRVAKAARLQQKGSSAEARKEFESVLPQLRQLGTSRELAQTLNGLSQLLSATGEYDSAAALARESVATWQSLRDAGGEARAWNNVGLAHLFAGSYSAGADEFARAVELARSAGDAKIETQGLNNLGVVFYYQARYSEAFAEYDRATQLLAGNAQADWYNYWRQITTFNQGTLYQRLGQEQRALDAYQQIEAHPAGLSPSDRAHLYANLGVSYRRLGDPVKAIESYKKAQRLYLQEKDTDGEIGVVKNIGIAQALDLGHLRDALATFDNALGVALAAKNRREILQARLYRAETLYRMDQVSAAAREFQVAIDSAKELQAREEQWKALYGLGRAAESAGDRTAAESHYREAIAIIEGLRSKLQLTWRTEFLGDKRDVYDALMRLLLPGKNAAELIDLLERSRSRSFQDRLQDETGRVQFDLGDIQSRLAQATLLLDLWTSGNRVAAVWATRDAAGVVDKEYSADEWNRLADFLAHLPDSGVQSADAAMAPLRTLVAEVAALQSDGVRQVIVVPDGTLAAMPFDVVRTTDGRMLIERAEVTYLPSAMLLLRAPASGGSWRWPWRTQVIAFGDPVVPAATSIGSQFATNLQPLPHSGDEVNAIAKMASGRSQMHVGARNVKSEFLRAPLEGAPIVHVSTHAVSDFERPERSRLVFSPAQAASNGNAFLFLRELYDMDLRGLDLVTLSACETERGRLVRGEGIQGFSRALLSRGARSAVTTLWQVPDEASAEFMKQFYFHLLTKGDTKAAALRAAKLKFIRSGGELAEPRYWAGFVLNGEGDRPVPRFISWSMVAGAVAALALLALVAVLLIRAGAKPPQAPQAMRPSRQAVPASE